MVSYQAFAQGSLLFIGSLLCFLSLMSWGVLGDKTRRHLMIAGCVLSAPGLLNLIKTAVLG
jgi:hypothetical protein